MHGIECDRCGKPTMAGLIFKIVKGRLLCPQCLKEDTDDEVENNG